MASLDSLQGHLSGLLAKTSASNAAGRQLDPGQVYLFGLAEAPSGGKRSHIPGAARMMGACKNLFNFYARPRPAIARVQRAWEALHS